MKHSSKAAKLSAVVAAAFVLGACGGAADDVATNPVAETSTAQQEPAAEGSQNQLPDVNVVDLATGEEVNLASFAPTDNPIVLWFWAPH